MKANDKRLRDEEKQSGIPEVEMKGSINSRGSIMYMNAEKHPVTF